MPYTLAKALVWLIMALALGLTIGWLLRSVAAHRQIARVRSQRVDVAELERLQARVTELEGVAAERDRLAAELAAAGTTAPAAPDDATGPTDPTDEPSVPLDEASQLIGRPVVRDDLQLIEGIGPSVEDLCHGIGIKRWADMASTEPSLLRTMLDDAGARFKTSDPTTWPRQAELLDTGRWGEFRDLVDGLRNGAPTT